MNGSQFHERRLSGTQEARLQGLEGLLGCWLRGLATNDSCDWSSDRFRDSQQFPEAVLAALSEIRTLDDMIRGVAAR
ncbi:hypothetical protein ABID21_001461 [Pseudorhizobium tarimense]|uniref:Uncharacterized protein n=1 Tax=Pseudorhizobium tarimense TaxID=1079109 RepID=A0ABV2H514_9HYPH|nr:hypothetical protein [Pseudorhizobium tarimense]MCJ8518584.1 hypothetical protein [Pseudorhizobium tarimense]